MSTAHYQVARLGDTVFVRSIGLANMKNAPMLDAFLQSEIAQGTTRACIDLSACTGMDSTFMGTLVGYSQLLGSQGGALVVVNPSDSNLKLLHMLGVSTVLPVVEKTAAVELVFVDLHGDPQLSLVERMELVRRAHQSLVALNPQNQAKFSAFLQALDSDLAKQRPASDGAVAKA